MKEKSHEDIARHFLLRAIQDWPGDAHASKQQATADYLRAAGFDVEPSGIPVFGAMFLQQPITGSDGPAAFEWLHRTLEQLQRGKFESEVAQLTTALSGRLAETRPER